MSTAGNDLAPGTTVGSYRIIRELGRGGMGSVYEAEHAILPRRAAVKVMHAELRRHPGMASRMVQEAAILEEIQHPGLVRIFECNVLDDQRVWMAMELIEGETLAARLERMDTMQAHDVASLLANVAEVLASVHSRSIVHRDLKPENLIYSSDSRFPIRVIDWGVARLGPVGKLTLEGMTPGTPIYMSPEQATGKNVGAPCDIYSLGVIAYEALSGEPPFDGRTLAEVVSMHLTADAVPLRSRCKAPRALCSLIHRMLAKDQTERPTAVQLGRLAKAIVSDLAPAYEEYIITHQSHYPAQQHLMQTEPTGETCVVDPQVLELGSTQPLGQPTRKLRWTPEISSTHMTGGAIVVGEILSKH